MKKHLIKDVKQNSIASEMDIASGDFLLSINNRPIHDIFDYQLMCEDEYIEIQIEKQNGEIWDIQIEKYEDEDLGLVFENGLMDEYQSCTNKCIFCFIDQMPPGMRDTLYFKDDDSRLSFLQGNYVTLTNMTEKDIERIIRYHLGPINISVHTMNPELRCEMLHNRFAGEKLSYMRMLYDAGIEMNGQIVLCKDINDGDELEYTIKELVEFAPVMQSVSVVPAGLTKYREGLYPLKSFSKEDAVSVIKVVEKWQKKIFKKYGLHFVHASDEWYLLADMNIPEEACYDGYPQLENGVGMIRSFTNEAIGCLKDFEPDERSIDISSFTGKLAYPCVQEICNMIMEKFSNVQIHLYPIQNDFFGDSITVTGLLTGQDICNQLKGKPLGNRLLIPTNTLKSGETVFLDDMTVKDLENNLQINAVIVKSSGDCFVKSVLGEEKTIQVSNHAKYEQ